MRSRAKIQIRPSSGSGRNTAAARELRRDRGREPDRREERVDHEHPEQGPDELVGVMRSANHSRATEAPKSVAYWASSASARIGPGGQPRGRLAEGEHDERGPERVPGVADARPGRARSGNAAADVLGELPEQVARAATASGNGADRKQEQHRDEHEFGRERAAAADLELDPRGDREGDHEQGEEKGRGAPRRGGKEGERDGDRDEAGGKEPAREPLVPEQRVELPFAPLLEELLRYRVELGRCRSVHRLSGIGSKPACV